MIDDDYSLNLHWHALNFRTAAPQDAQYAWVQLEACASRISELCLLAERERCATLCEHGIGFDPIIAAALAFAIRKTPAA